MNRNTISAECVGRLFCDSCTFEDCACECHLEEIILNELNGENSEPERKEEA